MARDPLKDALRCLPRQAAPDGFTERVLERAGRPAARRRHRSLVLVATTVAGAAVVALLLVRPTGEPGAPGASGPSGHVSSALSTPDRRPAPGTPFPASGGAAASATFAGAEDVHRILAELKSEHRRVRAQWHELRRLAREAEPVLYVGGTDSMDLVLDLRDLPPQGAHLTVTPAAVRRARQMTY